MPAHREQSARTDRDVGPPLGPRGKRGRSMVVSSLIRLLITPDCACQPLEDPSCRQVWVAGPWRVLARAGSRQLEGPVDEDVGDCHAL
jgi:hypothetical protein